ncbi:unnamed protein product [Symbiodinium microadriaticum]|nr:unnamed protein product [Symbiodinium microadriaticum]CAE7446974.1 unnamed protein product [Symbiodinium sp. KB8]
MCCQPNRKRQRSKDSSRGANRDHRSGLKTWAGMRFSAMFLSKETSRSRVLRRSSGNWLF